MRAGKSFSAKASEEGHSRQGETAGAKDRGYEGARLVVGTGGSPAWPHGQAKCLNARLREVWVGSGEVRLVEEALPG